MSYISLLEIDPDKIFIEFNIKEILEINRKIQIEIEKKRQELRCMVGERYRDVLTAADTIQCMQHSADTFKTHTHKINKKCYSVQTTTHQDIPTIVPLNKLKNFFRSVAVQIKILILIPEIIWMCLDSESYLKAVQIYLFAIHIHTGLELDTEHRVLEKFPLLSRLKLSINLFRNRILEGIKKTLKEVKLTAQECAQHISAYILLENKTQEQALKFLVDLRHESLLGLVNSEVTLHSAIRIRVLDLTHCLTCTIDLLTSSFVGDENQLVKTSLEHAVGNNGDCIIGMLELERTCLLEHIPEMVCRYGAGASMKAELSQSVLVQTLDDWLAATHIVLRTHLSNTLRHVTSVKVLYNIREEISNIGISNKWNEDYLDKFLPKNFNVWQYFIQPLISKRAEDLVRHKIKSNLRATLEKITSYLCTCRQGDNDLQQLVWRDATDDSRHSLAMKTRGFSPEIVELCCTLDNIYLELLQDVSLYFYGTVHFQQSVQHSSEEASKLEFYLREEVSHSMDRLVSHVEHEIEKRGQEYVLVGARLLQAVSQLCPNLKTCCSAAGTQSQDWQRVLDKLDTHCLGLWDNWLQHTEQHIQHMADEHLVRDITFSNVLEVFPKWDVIEIEEQVDDKMIKSQIKLPCHPSVSLVTLLSAVLDDLDSVVPHTIPKAVQDRFIDTLVTVVMDHYEKLSVNENVNQNLAIQLLLDIKFLTMVCVRRDCRALMIKSQEISVNLRDKVDPFDLNVFYSHLQVCIRRSVLQTNVLFGCLLGSNNQLSNIGVQELATEREPSILPYSVPHSEVWFPLLPVTVPVVKSRVMSPACAPDTRVRHASPTQAPTVRSGAAALLADWFS